VACCPEEANTPIAMVFMAALAFCGSSPALQAQSTDLPQGWFRAGDHPGDYEMHEIGAASDRSREVLCLPTVRKGVERACPAPLNPARGFCGSIAGLCAESGHFDEPLQRRVDNNRRYYGLSYGGSRLYRFLRS
jgi:hypothetical protein